MTPRRGNLAANRRRPTIPDDPKDRVIVSIPYSGTRFLQHSLKTPRCVHTYTAPERLCAYVSEAEHILVPLRRPEDNWLSTARRWPLNKDWDQCIAIFERSYMGMAWVHKNFKDKITFIKIGEPDTSTNLVRIGKQINVEPAKHAGKKGSEDKGENSHEYDVSHLYQMYRFVRDHYNRG